MNAKSPRPVSARAPAAGAMAPLHLLTDLGRQQFALFAEVAGVMFRGSEAIRKVQHEAAHEASLQHAAVAEKLQDSAEPASWLALQAELLRYDMQGAARYWQQLLGAGMQTQLEMMGCANHLIEVEAESGLKPALNALATVLNASHGNSASQSSLSH